MAIRLPAMRRSALPTTRILLETLGRSGVIRADGCVIASACTGGPPAGFDRVTTRLQAGFPPLDESRLDHVRAAMAAEALAIVNDLSPGDCCHGRIVQANYAVDPVRGIGLVVEVHGLVDHEARVFLN